jgi:3-hydroxybutyrate dehydrogenase
MAGAFQDRVAFITGAAGAIGLRIALDLAREGARVGLSDASGTEAAVQAVQAAGGEAMAAPCDVTREAELTAALDSVVAAWGRLDILVNNAGFQHVAPLESFPTDTFEQLLKVMLVAPFVAIKWSFPVMKKRGYGRIVNLASVNGLVGFAGKAGYNSAKHGLVGLTKVAALEGAPHGITVNALCPGYVETPLVKNQLGDLARARGVPVDRVLEDVIYPLVPLRRLLSIEEVSDYALFLASDRAGGITGATAVLDGGYTSQ